MNQRSGSIGIGAMIIFIALILVAAVASTVIINTVEDLQQVSESTGDDARGGLNDRVRVNSAYLTFDGAADCEATLFQHNGFAGWSATYPVGDYAGNDFLDPDDDGVNEAVSNDATAIKVDDGCEIIMYDGPDFSGWSARLGGGDHSLADIEANARPANCGGGGCNDQISSIKVLGFELLLAMQLAPGSYPIEAQDIFWTTTCTGETSALIDTEDIVLSGSTLMDGKNTEGIETNFVSGEELDVGMLFMVEATLSQCSPEIGDKITLVIHVDGGASSYYSLTVRTLDKGSDLMFN